MRFYEDMSRAELVRILEQKDEEIEDLQTKLDKLQVSFDVRNEKLEELEELLGVTWPIPTTKFVSENTITQQMLNVIEECGEASRELRTLYGLDSSDGKACCYAEIRLAKEIADIIFCCFTALAILGYDESMRSELFADTIKKNAVRGYYDV